MAKNTRQEWTIEQAIMAGAVVVVLALGAVLAYPYLKLLMQSMERERHTTRGGQSCAMGETTANSQAVFCTNASPGGPPTVSSVDTPLGAVRSLDHVLGTQR